MAVVTSVKGTTRRKFDPDSLYLRNSRTYVDPRDNQQKIDYQPPTINPHPTDDVYTVLPEEAWRPDKFAARVYEGRHFMARVLMRANQIFHVSEFTVGRSIRCPKLSRLKGTVI